MLQRAPVIAVTFADKHFRSQVNLARRTTNGMFADPPFRLRRIISRQLRAPIFTERALPMMMNVVIPSRRNKCAYVSI